MRKKYVYFFGKGKAEGNANMTSLLGGKGANLAEMTNLDIPVPPGFTITTEASVYYMKYGKFPPGCKKQIKSALEKIEKNMNQSFGCNEKPLLISIRSGARASMPGMMETVLNVGLTKNTIMGLIKETNNPRFVYDSYRRLMMMYSDVVMDKTNIEESNLSFRLFLDKLLFDLKRKNKLKNDADLSVKNLQLLCIKYQSAIQKKFDLPFPQNAMQQLWEGIEAVFNSWNGKRAKEYRKIENIPNLWGTAVNIQAMVFGNMGNDSATGVAFTRNPSTGKREFFGEWLPNAQGEDVVAGVRTPYPINNHSSSLEILFPELYIQLNKIQKKLEKHYSDMLDIEFTIQKNKLWLLQTRVGKRNGQAAIKIALDMLYEKTISKKIAINRIQNKHINELLLPIIKPNEEKKIKAISYGLPAGPGAACGQIIFSSDRATELIEKKQKIILVREETSPEDVAGMFVSEAILTARGGMTSHAALVARGWGKCCIVGCSEISINYNKKYFSINNIIYKENDWLTLNGTTGAIYAGKLPLVKKELTNHLHYKQLMSICQKTNKMLVRTNSDRKDDTINAKKMGAKGIGLCRTEHMFFNPQRIKIVRKMIITKNKKERKKYVNQLLPFQKNDFYEILKAMSPYPVTIRLLDPPLHEFLPQNTIQIKELAQELNIATYKLKKNIEQLHEINPMLGHRGCRLGITYPEITIMQTTAILSAALKLKKENHITKPEIMVPLVGSVNEFIHQKNIINQTANQLFLKHKAKVNYLVGTMIELPRACIVADQIAQHADFMSFGTNDLTQTTFGYSRDDIGSFLPEYLNHNILTHDPFASIDVNGVGELIKLAINKAKTIKPLIKIGVCGEHGGDPKSIAFFNKLQFDYVSCSPFRIPGAYLAIAQATL